VDALEKELEEARRREKEAAATSEAAERDDDDARAEALRKSEQKAKEAEERVEKLNAELEEAHKVVENASSATKEMETTLEELRSALDIADTKRVEAVTLVQKECAEEIANLNARVARIQSLRKEELEDAEARVKAYESTARESRGLAKQLLEKLNESVESVARDLDPAYGDDDDMTHETTPQRGERSGEKDAAEDAENAEDAEDAEDADDGDGELDGGEDMDAENHLSDSILADVEFPPTEKPTQLAEPLHDIGNSPLADQPSPSKRVGRNTDDHSPLPANVLED
jgi:DNA repair exonuclease SbcCD ATPase subunit